MTGLKTFIQTIISSIKRDKNAMFYAAIFVAFFFLFLRFFSFAILQSDDYYYASFWRDGPAGFIKLTADHFQNFNGRVFVHIAAQTVLSLPSPVFAVAASLIILGIIVLTGSFLDLHRNTKSFLFFSVLCYIMLMLLPSKLTRETLMWISAYFNYVMPLLFLTAALVLFRKGPLFAFPFAMLAGASTEQLGAGAIAALFLYTFKNFKGKKPVFFLPLISSCLGYFTIFLSPATRLRLSNSGQFSIPELLDSFTHYSEIFVSKDTCAVIMLIFIAAAAAFSLVSEKTFPLLSGIVPSVLIILSFFLPTAPAAFLSFLIYLGVCLLVFYRSRFCSVSFFIAGALACTAIIIPTNTYEPRISFPMAFLLIIASSFLITHIFDFLPRLSEDGGILRTRFTVFLAIMALITFMPSYLGFQHNRAIENGNLASIKLAESTHVCNYYIDYDKDYAIRQMFNDGWFYNEFISLYHLENTTVKLLSDIYPDVRINGTSIGFCVPSQNGKNFVPMRAMLAAAGGTLTYTPEETSMTLNDKTLYLRDGVLIYKDPDGHEHFEIADLFRNTTFFTLSLTPDILERAFGIEITESPNVIDIIL